MLHKMAVFSFLSLSLSLLLLGCGAPSGSSSGGAAGEKVSVTLRFRLPGAAKARLKTIAAPSAVASIQMTVRGTGMETISDTFSISPEDIVSRTFQVLPGSGRIFGGTIFDAANVALFSGETGPVELLPGSEPNITLVLRALFDPPFDLPLDLSVDPPVDPPPLFSELPRFSANYVLNDVPGILPFLGVSASLNYSAGSGVTAVTGEDARSLNYTLK